MARRQNPGVLGEDPEMFKITITISMPQKDLLKAELERLGYRPSEVIRVALQQYFDRQQAREIAA
jgi:hypothetical protein